MHLHLNHRVGLHAVDGREVDAAVHRFVVEQHGVTPACGQIFRHQMRAGRPVTLIAHVEHQQVGPTR